jgi:hypothetical protein
MKKNLLTIATILIIAITFGETTYAQIGNILNRAKDAIDKKKDKKKEQTQTPTDSTGTQSTGNQQTTKTNNGRSPIDDARIQIYLDDIKKAEKDVEDYINGKGDYLIYNYGDTNIVQPAISPKARAEYLSYKGGPEIDPQGKINAEFDKLAQMIDEPMRKYIPADNSFKFKKPAEIAMMKDLLAKENLTIYNIGIFDAGWLIEKDQYGLLPANRYKRGYVWAKDNGDDHPYCVRYEVRIIQTYAGGGTYGDSFAWKDYNSRAKSIWGCPTAATKTTPKPVTKKGKK